MRKNLLFAAIVAASLLAFSCSKSSSSSDEEDLNSLAFAQETVDAGKTNLSIAGDSLLTNLSALQNSTDLNGLECYSYFSGIADPFPNLNQDISFFNSLKAAGAISQSGEKFTAVFKSMSSTTTTDTIKSLQEFFNKYKGTHAWNDAFKRWDWYNKTSNVIDIQYPSTKTGTTNDIEIILTLTTSSDASQLNTYGISDVPATFIATIKKNKIKIAEYNFSAKYSNGLPSSTTTYISLGNYTFQVESSYSTSNSWVKYSFLRGTQTLLCYYAAANGNFDVNTINQSLTNDSSVNYLVNNANTYFQVFNIKLAGKVDYKSLYATHLGIDNNSSTLSDSTYFSSYADAYNKYSALVLVYADSNKKIAQASAYYDKTSLDVKYKLLFSDGTSQDLDTYFGSGFEKLTDDANALLEH